MTNPNTKIGVRVYLTLSFISAVVVGVFVWGGTRLLDTTLIWAGITFIVVLVGIATLALTVKDDEHDPNQPRLK
ncbi:MAG: hypothetical protein RJA26_374 [Actinomycetota bacterium]|jgi:hypothetical protein